MEAPSRFSDSIFVERLWRNQEVYLKAYQSVADARHGIGAYFECYNRERLHLALGYRAPRQASEEAVRHSPPLGTAGESGLC
jgi:putative transposase